MPLVVDCQLPVESLRLSADNIIPKAREQRNRYVYHSTELDRSAGVSHASLKSGKAVLSRLIEQAPVTR
jgi:hypothetical protein